MQESARIVSGVAFDESTVAFSVFRREGGDGGWRVEMLMDVIYGCGVARAGVEGFKGMKVPSLPPPPPPVSNRFQHLRWSPTPLGLVSAGDMRKYAYSIFVLSGVGEQESLRSGLDRSHFPRVKLAQS